MDIFQRGDELKGAAWQTEDVYSISFTRRATVTIVTATLNQLPSLAKPQRKCLAALLMTILALRGRVNYRSLACQGGYFRAHLCAPVSALISVA